MSIVRIPKVNNYTIMSNHHLTDPNLSLKAKGLMSYMLSRPDNWDFTIEGLARQNMEGADAIARIIRELEGRGYVIRSRTRNKAGKFTDMEYRILECPLDIADVQTITEENVPMPASDEPIPDHPIPNSPLPENPVMDIPNPDAPFPENAGQINTEPFNTEIPKTGKEKTEISNPDPSKTDLSIPADYAVPTGIDRQIKTINPPDIRKLTAQVRMQIGYYEMKESLGQAELDNVVSLIVEVLSAQCCHYTISGGKIPAELVKQRFQELNSLHIEYVFSCMKKAGSDIRNIKQYLLASLFNAPATMDSYYRAQVNHDLDFG